jgi:hypothetical protein
MLCFEGFASIVDASGSKFELLHSNPPITMRANTMGKNQWVTTKGEKWAVVGEGNSKATSIHNTQKQAIQVAKVIAQNQKSELIIQGKDSKIREKNSYGNDPCPPKDKR